MNFLKHNLLVLLIALLFISCSNREPVASLDLKNIEWKIYRNKNIGFELKFPAIFTYDVKDEGYNVFLKYNDANTLIIRYTSEQEGKKRGLWFGNEVSEVLTINSHQWEKYIYNHRDGPFVSPTTAYVTSLNDRFLGIEFRTIVENEEFQNYVMKSFVFLKPEAPKHIPIQ